MIGVIRGRQISRLRRNRLLNVNWRALSPKIGRALRSVTRLSLNSSTLLKGMLFLLTAAYILVIAPYATDSYEVDPSLMELVAEGKEVIARGRTCPRFPSTLRGRYEVDVRKAAPTLEQIRRSNSSDNPSDGIRLVPDNCRSRQKLAIIIPFRNRQLHLRYLLHYLHPFLQRQQREYQIFVAEQTSGEPFNRGRIMNIAFREALKIDDWDCFIFHDVDLIPQNDHNLYECGPHARHLSAAIDEMRYLLIYKHYVGGVLALSREQFEKVNGFSNLYWGWGSEDDDMSQRIRSAGYKILRPPQHIGMYRMAIHKKGSRDAFTSILLYQQWTRWKSDGLNSLHNFTYGVVTNSDDTLYTNLSIDIGSMPVLVAQPGVLSVVGAYLKLLMI